MVNLLKEVVKDIFTFLIIFFYSTLAFSFVYYALDDADSDDYSAYLEEAYLINFSYFDTEDFDFLEWVVFFAATMGNTIIMLNLLICILFETYDRVKQNLIKNDRKELAQIIFEGEINMLAARNIRKKKYLHVVVDKEFESEKDLVQEKLSLISKNVKSIERFAREVRDSDLETKTRVKNLEDKIYDIEVVLARIESKLNN